MSELPQLPPDQLSLVVFGPGFGESIVVHAPPGEWLVVDSLVDPTGVNPAAKLLADHRAEPSALLLTHPHEDHAAGFDAFVAQWPGAKIGFLTAQVYSQRDRLSDPDYERSLRSGHAEHAAAAICDAWDRSSARKWDVSPGSTMKLGEATISVLGPSKRALESARKGKQVNPNVLSTPLAISWQGTRLVLGADLPAIGWGQIARDLPQASTYDDGETRRYHN